MKTNITTQGRARVVGPETKESFAVIKKDRGALHSIKSGESLLAVLFGSVGMATAQQLCYPAGANQYYGLYDPAQHAPSFSRSDHIRYDHFGNAWPRGSRRNPPMFNISTRSRPSRRRGLLLRISPKMAFSTEKVTRVLRRIRAIRFTTVSRASFRRSEPMRLPGPRVKKVELTSFELMSCVKAA